MKSEQQEQAPAAPDDRRTTSGPTRQPPVDVERLAEKVYQLMLADARLARARHER
jgi:hypothetical protein